MKQFLNELVFFIQRRFGDAFSVARRPSMHARVSKILTALLILGFAYLAILAASIWLVRAGSFVPLQPPIDRYTQVNLSKRGVSLKPVLVDDEIPLVAIHGFMYNPDAEDLFNPHFSFFPMIARALPNRQIIAVGWDASPPTFQSISRMLQRGCLFWTCLARNDARQKAQTLHELLSAQGSKQFDILCHSIGCEMVAELLKLNSESFSIRNVVLINASLSRKRALITDWNSANRVTNLILKLDQVSRVDNIFKILSGADGSIGVVGLEESQGSSTRNIILPYPADDELDRYSAENSPTRLFNHLFAIEWPGYRAVIQEASDG